MVESAPPHQSMVRLFPLVSDCFLLLFARETAKDFSYIFPGSKILAGNSPAGPPKRWYGASLGGPLCNTSKT